MTIDGLGAYNKSDDSVNVLIAAYGNGLQNVDTGVGYSAVTTAGENAEFESFLDYLFLVNGTNETIAFNGTTWSTTTNVTNAPIARYIKRWQTRLYLGYVTYAGNTYRSRVWYSDLPKNDQIQWGLETGSDLSQTASSSIVTSSSALFKTRGIKTGDPFIVQTGSNANEYVVSQVNSETQITLTENLTNTTTNSDYWVGSNWFDVATDNNDHLRGLAIGDNRLLCFKLMSLHRYNGDNLVPIKGVVGTSSGRSIVNIGQYTLYMHLSGTDFDGLYLYDGLNSTKTSTSIDPFIKGISFSIYPDVVAWREGNIYRCYVGDITNAQRNISVSKAVISYDVIGNNFSIDPISHVIKCTTEFLESNQLKIFVGDNDNKIFQMSSGYNQGSSNNPVNFVFETKDIYPEGSEYLLEFTRIQVIARDSNGIRVRYKLLNDPYTIKPEYQGLGELKYDRTELHIPQDHRIGAGIKFRFEESSTSENTQLIEKITIFYKSTKRTT